MNKPMYTPPEELLHLDFSKLELRVAAMLPAHAAPYGATTGRTPETDEAFVERMERAYPHIKGEEA